VWNLKTDEYTQSRYRPIDTEKTPGCQRGGAEGASSFGMSKAWG